MAEEQTTELKVTIALLRSSLVSARDIVEACRNVVAHPETIGEEQRQSVIEILGVTLANIDELLERVPVEPTLAESSDEPQSPA